MQALHSTAQISLKIAANPASAIDGLKSVAANMQGPAGEALPQPLSTTPTPGATRTAAAELLAAIAAEAEKEREIIRQQMEQTSVAQMAGNYIKSIEPRLDSLARNSQNLAEQIIKTGKMDRGTFMKATQDLRGLAKTYPALGDKLKENFGAADSKQLQNFAKGLQDAIANNPRLTGIAEKIIGSKAMNNIKTAINHMAEGNAEKTLTNAPQASSTNAAPDTPSPEVSTSKTPTLTMKAPGSGG